jgi:hypothetical protein
MSDNAIVTLSLESLREILLQAGYRVETATDSVANVAYLRSATGGLAFDVRPGNRLEGGEQSFADVAFVAVLHVQGAMPLELVNRWNATRRFGRLHVSQNFLAFSMDVSAFGGVSPAYLRGQIEIWDRLAQDLIAYLRDELQKLTPANGADLLASDEAQSPKPDQRRVAGEDSSATMQ